MIHEIQGDPVAAGSSGQSDVAVRTVDSPVGELLIAATTAGVVRVAFDVEGHDRVLGELEQRIGPLERRNPGPVDEAARQLEEYFAGRRRSFDLPLDLRLVSGPFRSQVLHWLTEVPYGVTVTYAQLADLAGRPTAVRAAGTACATNPVPIVVPCHRVVRSDGSPGRYLGGVEAKSALLALESAAP